MTVKQWVDFLQKDSNTKNIAIKTVGYNGKLYYFEPDYFINGEGCAWAQDEVVGMYYDNNYCGGHLLIISPWQDGDDIQL